MITNVATIVLKGDAASAMKAFDSAYGGAKGLGDRLGGMGGIFSSFNGMLAGAGLAAVSAFGVMVKGAIDTADKFDEMSQRVGISVESLSALDFAARQNALTTEQLEGGLKKLNLALYDARDGGSQTAEMFDRLGIGLQNEDKTFKQTDEVLMLIADKFAGMSDMVEKSEVAVKLFGKSGADLIPLLNNGADGIEALKQRAVELGIVLDTQTAAASANLNDKLDEMEDRLDGLAISTLPSVVSAFSGLLGLITDIDAEVQGNNEYWGKFPGILVNMLGAPGLIIGGLTRQLVGSAYEADSTLKKLGDNARVYLEQAQKEDDDLKKENDKKAEDHKRYLQKEADAEQKFLEWKTKMRLDYLVAENKQIAENAAKEVGNAEGTDLYEDVEVIRMQDQLWMFGQIEAEKTAIAQLQAEERKAIADAEFQTNMALYSGTADGFADMFDSLYDISKGKGRALFEMHKAFKATEAGISTIAAVMRAYADIPFPFNIVQATAIGITGAMNVAKILQMQPGSGVSLAAQNSDTGGGGGETGGSRTMPSAPATISPTINFHIYGHVVDHTKFAREIVPYLTKAYGDGKR